VPQSLAHQKHEDVVDLCDLNSMLMLETVVPTISSRKRSHAITKILDCLEHGQPGLHDHDLEPNFFSTSEVPPCLLAT
jgi:hypothetical protein